MTVRLLDSLSLPGGSGPNEDAWGWRTEGATGAVWMIDGATGLGEREHVPDGPSDAAWYARTLSKALGAMATPLGDPRPAFATIVSDLADQWRAAIRQGGGVPEEVPAHALPSAALLWCGWRQGAGGDRTLALDWLGDCIAILLPPVGPATTFNRGALETADGRLRARISAATAAGVAGTDMLDTLMPDLRARRAMANQPGGYWVFGLSPEAPSHMAQAEARVPPGSRLLLASDGFYRLVDHFALFDDHDLVEAAATLGLAELGRRLRAAEQAASLAQVARVKPHDDASAVLLAFD